MKIFIRLMMIIAVLMILNGCYQVKTIIRVHKDGSGELEETVLMNLSAMGMNFMSGSGSQEDFHDAEDLKTKASQYGEGVVYKSSDPVEEGQFKGYKVIYSFKDITNLRIDETFSENILGEDLSNMGGAPDTDRYITFDFKKGTTPRLSVIFPRTDDEGIDDQQAMEEEEISDEELEMMSTVMSDLKVSLVIEVDGKITKSDALYQDKSKIVLMEVSFEEMLKDRDKFREFMELPENVSKEVVSFMQKNYPEIKYETSDEVYIEFK